MLRPIFRLARRLGRSIPTLPLPIARHVAERGGLAMNILDVMGDEEAFGPWFVGSSWDAWRCILKAAYALPMSASEIESFKELAGGHAPPKHRVRQLFIVGGRRAGKDSIASLLAGSRARSCWATSGPFSMRSLN
jgi:hypothetical protein